MNNHYSIYTSFLAQTGKESTCQCKSCGFDPWVEKIPEEGNFNPLQYSCLGNPIWQRSLVGNSPRGHKLSDMTNTQIYASYYLFTIKIMFALKTHACSSTPLFSPQLTALRWGECQERVLSIISVIYSVVQYLGKWKEEENAVTEQRQSQAKHAHKKFFFLLYVLFTRELQTWRHSKSLSELFPTMQWNCI